MDLRLRGRTSRSRSKTPFSSCNQEQEIFDENSVQTEVESVSRSIRKITTMKTVKSKSGSNSLDIEEDFQNVPTTSTKRITRSFVKTSDYSSEEDENEVSSTRSITENERNRIKEDAKKAANNSSSITALGLYRRAKRYWDEYPKTDWTYSPFSKDRVEIAPGVVAMPNMSRKHVSSYEKLTNTVYESYHQSSKLKKQIFSCQNKTDTTFVNFIKSTIITFIIFLGKLLNFLWRTMHNCYKSSYLLSIRVAKNIHRMTSRIMLLDTWLLRKRRTGGTGASLFALCLTPLLLIFAWWIISSMGSNIFNMVLNKSVLILETSLKSNSDEYREIGNNFIDDEIIHNYENMNYNKINFDLKSYVSQDSIINKILEKVETDSKLHKRLKQQETIIENLTNELKIIKSEIQKENSQKFDFLLFLLNRCCRKSSSLESYVIKSLNTILNNPELVQKLEGVRNLLHSHFVAKNELEAILLNLTKNLNSSFNHLLESNGKYLMEQVLTKLNEINGIYKTTGTNENIVGDINISDQKVTEIVKNVLKIYDSDKTGLVDYAMEPMGGEIITVRCTESYHIGSPVVSILGLPLWYGTTSPRTVITPGINPGKCWAFQNFPGLLVIKLMAPVKIEAFSLEHISKLSVPNGRIDSSPKDFEVFGLKYEEDRDGVKIGQYRYDYDGESLQFFIAQKPDLVFEYIELRITSNHGNPNYTCLYRFRVHGQKQSNLR